MQREGGEIAGHLLFDSRRWASNPVTASSQASNPTVVIRFEKPGVDSSTNSIFAAAGINFHRRASVLTADLWFRCMARRFTNQNRDLFAHAWDLELIS